jgi:hypothetical protein
MPIKGFVCPDGENVCYEECLKKCRLSDSYCGKRCLPEGYLAACLPDKSRPVGQISVTQISKPTLQTILEKNIDFYVEPDRNIDAIRGSSHHYFLEKVKDSGYIDNDRYVCEQRIYGEHFNGQIDNFDKLEGIIWDYKFVNGYKMKLMDADILANSKDYVFQQNCYRMLLQSQGHKVNKMMIFCAAYDVKYGRGRTLGTFDVPLLEDDYIIETVKKKVSELSFYSEMYPDILPDKCEETWGGKRCTTYCTVNFACPHFEQKGK